GNVNCDSSEYCGTLVGIVADYADNGNFKIINTKALGSDKKVIGLTTNGVDLNNTNFLDSVTVIDAKDVITNLQVGLYSETSSQIDFNTNFDFILPESFNDITSDLALKSVDDFIASISAKSTKIGAVQNRLESALESIEVNISNLTSSRSTIRDADVSDVSSEYIRQQILQQASATLLATANQTPALALQLL
ncbi:hypothetical protein IKB17_02505, partial [bacterium]|nr:hypothetical protein [bacterium]